MPWYNPGIPWYTLHAVLCAVVLMWYVGLPLVYPGVQYSLECIPWYALHAMEGLQRFGAWGYPWYTLLCPAMCWYCLV